MKRIFLSFALLLCLCAGLYARDVEGQVRSYKVGSLDFIALKDIETNMGREILLRPEAEVVGRVMANNQNPSSINAFLVKSKDRIILIDAGIGEGGMAVNNLETAGVNPKDVDIVIITHMHGDHIGGLVSSGGKVFGKAFVYINDKELAYWTGSISRDPGTSALAGRVKAVYGDKIKTFKWDDNITPEIKAIAAPGHTPGHTVLNIESDGEKIIVIGDLVHVLKVQTADPNMAVIFDVNSREAVDSRKKIFKDVSKNKTRVAGMHIPFPGVGTIVEETGGEYIFSPSVSIR